MKITAENQDSSNNPSNAMPSKPTTIQVFNKCYTCVILILIYLMLCPGSQPPFKCIKSALCKIKVNGTF